MCYLDQDYSDRKRAIIPAGTLCCFNRDRYRHRNISAIICRTFSNPSTPRNLPARAPDLVWPRSTASSNRITDSSGPTANREWARWSRSTCLACRIGRPWLMRRCQGTKWRCRGTETVLLVEDEDALRRAAAEFLSLRGYTVLEARDGLDALSVAKNHAIDDPSGRHRRRDASHERGTNWRRNWKRFVRRRRVLFVSGYAGQTVMDHKVVDVENNFLQKPFTLKQLASKVRTVLDHSRNAVARRSDSSGLARISARRYCAYDRIRVSLPSFKRKRSPRQVTVWPPRLSNPDYDRNQISQRNQPGIFQNLAILQNARPTSRATAKRRNSVNASALQAQSAPPLAATASNAHINPKVKTRPR